MTEPLRIALVTMSFRQSGAEKQFVFAARVLASAGMEVRVLHLVNDGYYLPVLQRAGIPMESVAGPNPVARLFRLARAARRFRPHLVQANHFGSNAYAWWSARNAGALAVGAVRSTGNRDVRVHGFRGPWLLRLPDALVVNSHAACDALRERGVPPERLAFVPNVVDLAAIDNLAPVALPVPATPGQVLVATVGRLIPEKRLDIFLRALALARPRCPQLRGLVVGDGMERAKLEECARNLRLSGEGVMFLGHRADAVALLRHAHVLVVTSAAEGFPNVILEAMACGLPVITTPAGEAPHLVRDHLNGLVVGFEAVETLADALVRMGRSACLRGEWGAAGRRMVENRYGLEHLAAALSEAYAGFGHQFARGRHPFFELGASGHSVCS